MPAEAGAPPHGEPLASTAPEAARGWWVSHILERRYHHGSALCAANSPNHRRPQVRLYFEGQVSQHDTTGANARREIVRRFKNHPGCVLRVAPSHVQIPESVGALGSHLSRA